MLRVPADVHRILKPGGRFINMEPHFIFRLLPWLGEVERPFSILTEYGNRSFGVVPSISELIQADGRGGFAVIWMDEVVPEDAFKTSDPRAYHFAKEFPIWQIFELKPL